MCLLTEIQTQKSLEQSEGRTCALWAIGWPPSGSVMSVFSWALFSGEFVDPHDVGCVSLSPPPPRLFSSLVFAWTSIKASFGQFSEKHVLGFASFNPCTEVGLSYSHFIAEETEALEAGCSVELSQKPGSTWAGRAAKRFPG